jgi:hypothetical protein
LSNVAPRWSSRWFGSLLACSWAPALAAQPNSPHELGRNAEAVAEGRLGLEAWERSDFAGCERSFSRAESISHSPVFLLYTARCLERQRKLVEARRVYDLVANEQLGESAAEAWRAATIDAARERADLASRVPSIVISIRNAPAGELSLVLDGASVDSSGLGKPLELDPGEHHLQATRRDGSKVETRFLVAEGQRFLAVELAFPEPSSPPPPPPPASPPAKSPLRTAGYVATGIGLAGLLVGAASGVAALVRFSSIKDRCDGNRCDPDDEASMSSVRTLASVSDVGFVIAAGGLGTGGVLLWVVPDGSSGASLGFGTAF